MQIVVNDVKLCPNVGYHPFVDQECGPAFVKCAERPETDLLEGTVYRCPRGYSFWKVSRRCEKTEKLSNCKQSRLGHLNDIPVEWINLGRARNLRF